MEQKLFMRKTDKKVFKLLDIKHFMLNNKIKETGQCLELVLIFI